MKAAVLRDKGGPLVIEELELDPPKAGEVKIKMVATGICHSDFSVINGKLRAPLPVVLGHEGAGIVTELGEGVTDLAVGDHVICSLSPSCGVCPMCKEGKPFLCVEMGKMLTDCCHQDGTYRFKDKAGDDVKALCAIGSFAEEAVIPAGCAIKVADDVPLDKVCLVGCGVTTGTGAAVNTADIKEGDTVAVIGCGGVGMSIIQGARIKGASIIICIDPTEDSQKLALEVGATHVINPFTEDTLERVKEICGGMGVNHAFEALGKTQTMEQAFNILRPGGEAIIVGVTSLKESLKLPAAAFLGEFSIVGSLYGDSTPKEDLPMFVDWYTEGKLKLDEMITKVIKLEDINDALDEMSRGEGVRTVIIHD